MFQISLEAARVNANKTQADAAKALNRSVSTIKNWESGRSIPDASDFRALCALYRIPADLVFLPTK